MDYEDNRQNDAFVSFLVYVAVVLLSVFITKFAWNFAMPAATGGGLKTLTMLQTFALVMALHAVFTLPAVVLRHGTLAHGAGCKCPGCM